MGKLDTKSARDFLNAYRSSKTAMLGLAIMICSCAITITPTVVSPYNPYDMSALAFLPPGRQHPFGTDNLGRDVLSRVIWGTRVSLAFGFVVAGMSLMLGVILGAIPGYFGGLIDDVFSRFFEVYLMIPSLFLIILVTAIFGTNIMFTMAIVGLTMWPSNARITRAQVLTLKDRAFVQAAKCTGAGHLRIIFTHILPNGIYPVIVNSTLQMGSAILTEASLSFLGLGDVNHVSWGQIIFTAQNYFATAWWMAVFPGIAILALVLAFNLIGDGINLAMNPRLSKRT